MYRMLPVIIIIGVLVALFPIIVGAIDQYIYSIRRGSSPAIEEVRGSEGIVVLRDTISSSTGSDTLAVSPGSIWVPYGGVFTLKITVYFKHAQPCPYSDWSVSYSVDGDLEVINETKGELIDSKTYVKEVVFRVLGNATITIIYSYGSGCPEGNEERVIVTVYTGEIKPATTLLENISETETEASTSEIYISTKGYIESIDYSRSVIIINGITVYIKGSWTDGVNTYEKEDVIKLLNTGVYVELLCHESGSGRIIADRIILDNTTLERLSG